MEYSNVTLSLEGGRDKWLILQTSGTEISYLKNTSFIPIALIHKLLSDKHDNMYYVLYILIKIFVCIKNRPVRGLKVNWLN